MASRVWPHGDTRRYWSGCRCEHCKRANARFVKDKRRQKNEASLPHPYYAPWMLERPIQQTTAVYEDFGAVRKAVAGICKAKGGTLGEPLVLAVWNPVAATFTHAYSLRPGTLPEDFPWSKK